MSTNLNHYNLGHFLTPSLYAFPFHSILMEQFYIQYVLLITPTLSTIYNLKYVYPLSLFRVSIAQRYLFFLQAWKELFKLCLIQCLAVMFGSPLYHCIEICCSAFCLVIMFMCRYFFVYYSSLWEWKQWSVIVAAFWHFH